MRVVHMVPYLTAGGVELHLLTLCRYLKESGHDPILLCLQAEYEDGARSLWKDFHLLNVDILDLKNTGYWDLASYARLSSLIRKLRPDIIHTHLPRADLAMAFLRWRGIPVPWLCSIHGVYATHWRGSWALRLFDRIWRRADGIVAISEAVEAWLVKERGLTLPRLNVIHYGIEPERFCRPNTDLRKAMSLGSRPLIVSIGRFEHGKGYDILIKAMPAVLQRIPQALLLLAGHDPRGHGKSLQELIGVLKLNGRVRLLGFQSDVSSLLHAADIFAFASRSEGFGQVVIEAMAAGKPVVASRIPPLTEIVVDEETGLLAEPNNPLAFANAISRLLAHADEAKRLGKRGKERVRSHFSAARMSAQTLALYGELVCRVSSDRHLSA